jgi:hypothetical protein
MMKFFSRAIWLACCLSLLCSACGQKGRLVMPVRPPPVSTPYPTALPKDSDAGSVTEPATVEKTVTPIPGTAPLEK